MLRKKLFRTIGCYKAQFISMIIMIALGLGVFIGFNMEWVSIRENTESFFESTSFADYRIVSEAGFTSDEFEKIEDIAGVDAATRYISINTDIKGTDGDGLALTVTENPEVSGFIVTDGAEYDETSEDGIWLSDRFADANDISIGDTLTLVYKNIEINGSVKGLIKSGEHLICVRDESQLMPDYDTFGFCYISPVMYENAVGMDYYTQINVISDMEKKEFTEAVEDVLTNTNLVLSKDENTSYAGAEGEINEGKIMGALIPVLFLLIAVLTMVTTMHRVTAKEKIQIGTLKALGFKDKKITRHYTSYALFIAIIGEIFGVALGYMLAASIMSPDGSMGTYLDMPDWKLYMPWFCVLVMVIIIVMLTFIGYLSVKKMLVGNAADVLRPYAPKKVKDLIIEKTKWFHNRSFGTRWNLRDIARHKSRTAMSVLGTLGCMVIIVCAMGMSDTMDYYVEAYYEGAIRYSTRIYISEDATDEERDCLISKYNGDWSASISVQIEEEAVSLDIYGLENGLVRFIGDKTEYQEITDDGAYICRRIAEEFDLSEGDTFTASPYGEDTEYTLTVAGIICSISESVVITPAYAEKIGISYVKDSVYTDTAKSDISADAAVKSVQSKQAIAESFDTMMEVMDTMILMFILGGLILGVVVLYNLGVMGYTERYTEMATLKVVGFKDKKIGQLLVSQNLWISFVCVIIGIPIGAAVLDFLLDMLASEYEMKMYMGPATYIVSVVLTIGVSLIVSLMVSAKNKKIDMVEALKSAD